MPSDYPAQYAALQARAEQRRKPLSPASLAQAMLTEGAKWFDDTADWSYEWNDNDRDHIIVRAGEVVTEIPVGANPIDAAAVYRAMLRHALHRDWDAPANRRLLEVITAYAWSGGSPVKITMTRQRLLAMVANEETP